MFNRDAVTVKKGDKPASDEQVANVTSALAAAAQGRLEGAPAAYTARGNAEPSSDTRAKESRPWEEQKGSRLVVGADIKLKGVEITDCDTLFVEGRVEASLDARVVQVAENGVFAGTASMDVAEIWGRFEGELTARKHLIIHASGRVSGSVRYGSIQIDEGGELTGDVNTLQQKGAPSESAASHASTLSLKTTAYQPASPAKQTATGSGTGA